MAKSVLKFKDSVAAYEQLAGQIAARRFVPIYLLMGEESYFIDAIAEQIATTVLGEAERDRKSTRLNSSHYQQTRMPSSA